MVIENGVVIEGTDVPEVVIPEGVTKIGFSAFSGCSSIRAIRFPESLTEVGTYAFSECRSLEELDLPDGITTVEQSFHGCTALKRVRLPQHLQEICPFAFVNCPSLAEITLPECLTDVWGDPFDNATAILVPTQTAGMIRIAPRRSFPNCYANELRLLLQILHEPERYAAEFAEMKVFEYRAAAAVFLLQRRSSETASAFLRKNFKRIAEDYIAAADAHMTVLLLETGCYSPAQRKNAAKTAQAAGLNEIYSLLDS